MFGRDPNGISASARERPFDPRSFLLENATIAEAASVLLIVSPGLVEYRRGVFLEFAFSAANVDLWLDELRHDVPAVEAVVNHLHLWDVFAPTEEQEYLAVSEFAKRMGNLWRTRLKEVYPDQEFEVTVSDEPSAYGPTVTFASI